MHTSDQPRRRLTGQVPTALSLLLLSLRLNTLPALTLKRCAVGKALRRRLGPHAKQKDAAAPPLLFYSEGACSATLPPTCP